MDLGLWFAPPDRHQKGLQRQIGIGAALYRPADDPPGKQIDHDGQIQKILMRADVGDVSDPKLIRGIDVELPVQRIIRHDGRAATIRARLFL